MPLGDHIPALNSDKLKVSMVFFGGVLLYRYSYIGYRHRPFMALKQQAHQDGQGLSVVISKVHIHGKIGFVDIT
jgi:hypothetical protein